MATFSLHHHSSVFLETPDQWERIQVIPRKRLASGEMEAVVDTCQEDIRHGLPYGSG